MNQYKKTAIFSMACGSIAVLLGFIALMWRRESVSYLAVGTTMVINTVLHFESYISELRLENRRQPNTLAMAITEMFLLVFFAVCLKDMGWCEFIILFSTYLVFNGTSLMAIPSPFARYCGATAALLGGTQFLFGREFGTIAAVFVGANLILNGGERIVMSALGGKKK